jgi:hypothetical protein
VTQGPKPRAPISTIISAHSSDWTGGAVEAVVVVDGRAGAAA